MRRSFLLFFKFSVWEIFLKTKIRNVEDKNDLCSFSTRFKIRMLSPLPVFEIFLKFKNNLKIGGGTLSNAANSPSSSFVETKESSNHGAENLLFRRGSGGSDEQRVR